MQKRHLFTKKKLKYSLLNTRCHYCKYVYKALFKCQRKSEMSDEDRKVIFIADWLYLNIFLEHGWSKLMQVIVMANIMLKLFGVRKDDAH